MIEPLRFNKEISPAYELIRPVFCTSCLGGRQSRHDPNISTVYCAQCPAAPGETKAKGCYLCTECDETAHRTFAQKAHTRHIVVSGPGLRKLVQTRGDGKNFPMPLDEVKVRVKARVYHAGKKLFTDTTRKLVFTSGMSGKCIHVQVLGCRDLIVADNNGTSDPFVMYSYCGKPLGSTRVRPRNMNPMWDNETFIVPIDERLQAPRDMVPMQKDIFKLEVFDYDWLGRHDLLGQMEMSRAKLQKLAVLADEKVCKKHSKFLLLKYSLWYVWLYVCNNFCLYLIYIYIYIFSAVPTAIICCWYHAQSN